MPSTFSINVPFVAAVPPLRSVHVRPPFAVSGSLSLPVTFPFKATSSLVVKVSSFAVGASFTGVTVMVTVAGSHAELGSQAW